MTVNTEPSVCRYTNIDGDLHSVLYFRRNVWPSCYICLNVWQSVNRRVATPENALQWPLTQSQVSADSEYRWRPPFGPAVQDCEKSVHSNIKVWRSGPSVNRLAMSLDTSKEIASSLRPVRSVGTAANIDRILESTRKGMMHQSGQHSGRSVSLTVNELS